MFRLLRDHCFFINHHHHFRITLSTIHSQLNLTKFCSSLFELWLVSPKVFRLLRDRISNSDTVYSPSTLPSTSALRLKTHHCISAIPLSFRKTTTAFRYHHLTFDVWDFVFPVFPFPKVFQLLRDESTSSWYLHQEHHLSSSPRMVTATTPLYIPFVIALITPSPFCVTYLSRLAIWVLPAMLLVHISGLHHTLHTYHIILVSYHPLCSFRIYTIAILVCALCKSGHWKKSF